MYIGTRHFNVLMELILCIGTGICVLMDLISPAALTPTAKWAIERTILNWVIRSSSNNWPHSFN